MWIKHPGIIRSTSLLRVSSPGTMPKDADLLVGYNGFNTRNPTGAADVGKFCWYSSVLGKYVVSDGLDCSISANGDTLTSYGVPVNGFPAWSGSTYCLFWGAFKGSTGFSNGWIIIASSRLGYIPSSTSDFDWWVNSSNDPRGVVFAPQGTASASVTPNIGSWSHWESSTQYGIYTPVSGASGNRIVGIPRYTDGAGKSYDRTLMKTAQTSGHYNYGNAKWRGTADGWVIGTYDDVNGWWSSTTEPNTISSTTFHFHVPAGSEVTGENIVLTFSAYVEGAATVPSKTMLIGEAAIWRN